MGKKTTHAAIWRAVAMTAALLILLASFCACVKNDNGGTDESTTEPQPVSVAICSGGASEYQIVRPDRGYTDTLKDAVQLLRKSLSENANVDMKVIEDWVKDVSEIPAEAAEILIGNTNRPESAATAEGLRVDDFRIKYCAASRRLVIVGGSDEATAAAVGYFAKTFVGGSSGTVEISSDYDYTQTGDYEVTSMTINGQDISKFEIVIPDSANRDEKYAAELISDAIADKTGTRPAVLAAKKATGSPSLRIGGAADAVDVGAGELCVGSAPGQSDVLLIGGKGGYVVAAANEFISKYIDGAVGSAVIDIAAAAKTAFAPAVYPADSLGIVGGTRVALADQKNAVCAIVDLASGNNAPVLWSFAPTAANGFSVSKSDNRLDECRLRYSAVLGKYVVCVTSSSGFIGVGEYPTGKRVFDASLPGYGPHSMEYLPSGAVAVACSGNGNESKAMIRFYAADEKGGIKMRCQTIALEGAHGVIWDDVRNILWAVGTKSIVAFRVVGSGTAAELEEISIYRATLPKAGGHDIAAFYGNSDLMWIGGGNIVIFNKTNGTFAEAPGTVSVGNTKCIGNFDDGRIIRTVATGVYAAHDTDRYVIFGADGSQQGEVVYSSRAFYKARIFDPRYT